MSVLKRLFVTVVAAGSAMVMSPVEGQADEHVDPTATQARPGPGPSASRVTMAVVQKQIENYGDPTIKQVVGALEDELSVHPTRLRQLARRARQSGWVPTLRLGARRGQQRDLSEQQSTSLDKTNTSLDDEFTLQAWLTFRLDQVVYHRDQVALAREHRAVENVLGDLKNTVVALYFERRRLMLERDLSGKQDVAQHVRIARVSAQLDALTGHRFAAFSSD